MHPNPQFHHDDRALAEALIEEVGFGMVFVTTPDGPRVAHTPLHSTGDGAVQFHVSRGNALARHLDGEIALCVINGPDGYVSPRWYEDQDQVPTWNYVSLELEGRLDDGLEPWTMDKLSDGKRRQLMSGIVGFEMEVLAWRPTLKLSQNKPADERGRVADGLEASGHPAIAALMRTLVP